MIERTFGADIPIQRCQKARNTASLPGTMPLSAAP